MVANDDAIGGCAVFVVNSARQPFFTQMPLLSQPQSLFSTQPCLLICRASWTPFAVMATQRFVWPGIDSQVTVCMTPFGSCAEPPPTRNSARQPASTQIPSLLRVVPHVFPRTHTSLLIWRLSMTPVATSALHVWRTLFIDSQVSRVPLVCAFAANAAIMRTAERSTILLICFVPPAA